MKKLMFLSVLVFCSGSFAEDGVFSKAETVPALTASTVTTPQLTQTTWSYILSNVLSTLAVPLLVITSAFTNAALVAVAKHFNVQVSAAQQDIVKETALTAVAKAEAWATAHKDTPTGNDKLNYAIQAMRLAGDNTVIKNYTNEQLAHYAEEAVYKMFNQTDPNDIVPPVKTGV